MIAVTIHQGDSENRQVKRDNKKVYLNYQVVS